jgi:hypothetical protein
MENEKPKLLPISPAEGKESILIEAIEVEGEGGVSSTCGASKSSCSSSVS